MKISEQALVRELNTAVVMDSIRLHAPISRAEIATRTGLNRSTVTLIINELIDRGFVQETIRRDPTIGRPGTLLTFNPSGGFAIGVEIGVDFLSVMLTNFTAEVLWQHRQPIAIGTNRFAIMETAENLIGEAVARGQELGLRPLGIGVGLPGLVDERNGKLVFAPNLKWTDIPLRLIWVSRFDMPVFIENEANCAAMGEYFFGVAHDVKHFIYLKTGVGLGAGVMIDGQLFRGAHGFAGEVGHTALYGAGGDICGCGRSGCWETYVSQSAIIRLACQKMTGEYSTDPTAHPPVNPEALSLEALVAAAASGDPAARSTFQEVGVHLGIGLANLINIFNPELVVLGGALSQANPWLTPVIKSIIQDNVLPPLRERTRIEVSAQGEDACVLGAVAFVLDNVLREPINSH